MRVFAAVLLGMSLAASPLLARNAGETGKEDTPVAASSASALPDKPTAVKPEASAIESEMQDLRSLVEEQRAELESQRAALKAEQLKMEALEEKLATASPSSPAAEPVARPAMIAPAASPAITSTSAISSTASAASPAPAQKADDETSPLQLKIGSAYITPVGFMDFTAVFRSHDEGSGIGTNFAGIKFGNTFNTHLSELRESMQNSRIGFRIDALVKGAHVMGYMESDYLGNNPGNVAVSSNSNTLRSRVVLRRCPERQVGNSRRPDLELDHSGPNRNLASAGKHLLYPRHRRKLPGGPVLGAHPGAAARISPHQAGRHGACLGQPRAVRRWFCRRTVS